MNRLLFNFWYFFNPPWDTGISPPELLAFIRIHPAGRALDLGCGTGTNVLTLAQSGWQATGVDFAYRAIQEAQKKASQMKLQHLAHFRVGDVTQLNDIQAPFDLVLDMGCFHSLEQDGRRAYADNLSRLLAPGGVYMLYVIFRNDASQKRGIYENDLQVISPPINLTGRQDGQDRGKRASAWLTYQKTS